jgi:photosystem II stability/assembly factor-like uncharacterized protein
MFLCVVIVSPVNGQSIWEWQNPFPQGHTLTDIDVRGASLAVACGKRATIVHTNDGGGTWSVIPMAGETTENLNGVCVIDAGSIVAVGYNGIILLSADSGVSWSSQASGVSVHLNEVDFVDASFGIAVGNGGTILTSSNGGVTWTPQTSGTSADLYGVHMIDTNTGFVVGSAGTIRSTTDGGTTWAPRTSLVSETLKSVHFYDAGTGIAVGNGPVVVKTEDGGSSWMPQWLPVPPSFDANLESVWMATANDVVVVGTFETDYSRQYGYLMHSSDGGVSWDLGTGGDFLYGVAMFDINDGLAVGATGTIRQVTAGVSWPTVGGGHKKLNARAVDFSSLLQGAAVASDNQVYLSGGTSRIYSTSNGGSTWSFIEVWNHHFVDIAFADALTVYAVGHGWPAMDQGSSIWKSDDGGTRWGGFYGTFCAPDGSGCDNYFSIATAIDFAGPDFGVTVGTQGAIVLIMNGSPCRVETPFSVTLNGVSVPSSAAAYAVGDNGFIVKGTSSGSVWTPQTSGTTVRLNDAAFTDDLTGTAVGALGTILRTEDGGAKWIPQSSGTTANLTSVSCVDAYSAIITAGATLLKTMDGGATWIPELTPLVMVNAVLIDIANVEAVGGSEGIIARRDVPIPVLFHQFIATLSGSSVHLTWDVWSDIHINEFHLYRSEGQSAQEKILHARIDSQERSYLDTDVRQGVEYRYLLVAMDRDGHETWSQEVSAQMPVYDLELLQNHPNPFNPSTTIRFRIPDRRHTVLAIYDVSGRHIATLFDAPCELGEKSLTWDGRDSSGSPVSSGIYFYQLKAGLKKLSKKMVLLR